MWKIGGVKPRNADLPIPHDQAALAQLKHLLRTPGGLNTAEVLPAYDEIPQYPGLFSEDLYADVNGPEADSLFDSEGKRPPKPAPEPIPIVHYLQVPRKPETPPVPCNSATTLPSHDAHPSSGALATGQEAERRIRERLLQDGSGGAPRTSQKALPPPRPDKPVNKFAVNWVRDLLNGKEMAKVERRDLDRASEELKQMRLDPAEVRLGEVGKPYFFVPADYSKMDCEAAIEKVEEYAFYAESLNDKDASARAQGLLHFLRQCIEDLSRPARVPRFCPLNDTDLAEVEIRTEIVRRELGLDHKVTAEDLRESQRELVRLGFTIWGTDEGVFYRLPDKYSDSLENVIVALERYTQFAWAIDRKINVTNGLILLEHVKARAKENI